LAKKGEKLSEETKRKMRESKIRDKELCKHCEKLFVDLDKHKGNCRKNPENKERFHNERMEYLSRENIKSRVQSQKATVWRKWYPDNSKRLIEKRKKNYPKEKDKLNSQRNIRRPKNDEKTRNSLFGVLGGYICAQCKFNDHRSLDIDHIHNTGHLDNKRFSDDRQRNAYYVKHPIEAINNLQILCSNCNTIKEYERKNKKWNESTHSTRSIRDHEEYQKLKNSVFQILGGHKCSNPQCGFNDHRALHIDHIHGDGRLDRENYSRQNDLFRFIITNSDEVKKKLQILCANCNQIKARTT